MEWDRFHRLVDDTVKRLKTADGDLDRIDDAVQRYVERGDRLGMSPMILWDYFAISSPGIPDQAGYCGIECEKIEALFERLMSNRFQ